MRRLIFGSSSWSACGLSLYFGMLVVAKSGSPVVADDQPWKKHVVHSGLANSTAVGGDFSGDGLPDVISNSGGKTRLFVAPDWQEIVVDEAPGHDFIHSEVFDIDGDGKLDYVGARYSPGLLVWIQQPPAPLADRWPVRIIDDAIDGIHGVLKGDVDGDGKLDLIANSAQPVGPFANSAVWLRRPKAPRDAERWERHVFANKDAQGLSHYFGFGDVNGDGRPDISLAAKGGPAAEPNSGEWFAWWEAPQDPRRSWKKHLLADRQDGATCIMPADVNGDGHVDFIATRPRTRRPVVRSSHLENTCHPPDPERTALSGGCRPECGRVRGCRDLRVWRQTGGLV